MHEHENIVHSKTLDRRGLVTVIYHSIDPQPMGSGFKSRIES